MSLAIDCIKAGKQKMKVDYHIHTLCSDGIYTVDEVFEKVLSSHIEAFSITDHDTIEGIKRARQLSENKVSFTSGLEITCREKFLPSVGISFSIHLLGYGFDENYPGLVEALNERKQRAKKVFEALCREISGEGYPVQVAEIPVSCGNVLQLCDVENYIKASYGMVEKQVLELIGSYSEKLSNANITPEEGIRLIHVAGGKAVWAHPFHVYQSFRKTRISCQQAERILAYLMTLEIDGLEAYYSAFSEEEKEWLRTLAKSQSLFCTAGSDFHGSKGRDEMGMQLM